MTSIFYKWTVTYLVVYIVARYIFFNQKQVPVPVDKNPYWKDRMIRLIKMMVSNIINIVNGVHGAVLFADSFILGDVRASILANLRKFMHLFSTEQIMSSGTKCSSVETSTQW